MRFDGSKACFISFGDCNVEEITLTTPEGSSNTVKFSDTIRYLGFWIREHPMNDNLPPSVGVSLNQHLLLRCTNQNFAYEKGILKWVANNFYFNNKLKRSIVLTRTVPKLFFGTATFMRIDDELDEFEFTYGYHLGRMSDKGKWILSKNWWIWPKMDEVNKRLATVTGLMAKGMTLDLCTS